MTEIRVKERAMRRIETGGQSRRHVELRRGRRAPVTIQIAASPAFDFFWSLHIAFCPPHYHEIEDYPAWCAAGREVIDPATRATLAFFFSEEEGRWWCTPRLNALLWRAPDLADVPGVIAWLGTIPARDVLTVIIERDGLGEGWREVAAELITSAATPDATLSAEYQARALSFAKRFPLAERDDLHRFLTDPEAERRRLIAALSAWYDLVFAAQAERLRVALSAEGARMTDLQARLSPEALCASVLRGIEINPPAAVDRIVLAPSALIMPTIFSFQDDDTITYCYPFVADAAQHNAELLQRREMIRLFDALADDTRLRILRLLMERRMYLTELADHLRLTKATTRHHMIRLRAAGLVTLHEEDHLSYFTLRRETLDEPTRALQRYLPS